MFHRILIPTDGSDRADAALEIGRRVAKRDGASVILLRVEPSGAERDEALAAAATMAQQAHALSAMGTTAEYRLAYGRPEEGIAGVAEQAEADLIVMSRQHREMLAALRHPSVTARELSRAPAPILIWPEGLPVRSYDDLLMAQEAAVIVPLDGSAEAERALPLAVHFAERYERPLLLTYVLVPMPTTVTSLYQVAPVTPLTDDTAARAYLGTIRTRIAREERLPTQVAMPTGDAADEIARLAHEYTGSLVVMTTHGRTGLARLLLGSVASRLLERGDIPLLVVPPRRQDALRDVDDHGARREEMLAGTRAAGR